MCSEIQAACRETAQPIPESNAELARCIFDSLALLYADVLHDWRSYAVKISRNCILSAEAARTRCLTSYVLMPAVFG